MFVLIIRYQNCELLLKYQYRVRLDAYGLSFQFRLTYWTLKTGNRKPATMFGRDSKSSLGRIAHCSRIVGIRSSRRHNQRRYGYNEHTNTYCIYPHFLSSFFDLSNSGHHILRPQWFHQFPHNLFPTVSLFVSHSKPMYKQEQRSE